MCRVYSCNMWMEFFLNGWWYHIIYCTYEYMVEICRNYNKISYTSQQMVTQRSATNIWQFTIIMFMMNLMVIVMVIIMWSLMMIVWLFLELGLVFKGHPWNSLILGYMFGITYTYTLERLYLVYESFHSQQDTWTDSAVYMLSSGRPSLSTLDKSRRNG